MLNPPYMPHFGRCMRWQDTGRAGTLYYPIWLCYAAGLVEQEYETRVVDAPAWDWDRKQVLADIKMFEPDLIVMDSSFPSLNNDISVAEEIRECSPSVKVVLVGPPASQFPERILQSKGIDIVARWEYDLTIREIVDTLAKDGGMQNIKGISYKQNRQILHNPNREFTKSEDLDSIPFVSKVYAKHLNVEDYFLGNSLYPEVQIFTGRGCPFQCTFCSWPQTLMGKKYRVRSIPNVVDEMEWIQRNLPQVKEIFFEDDTFTIDKTRVIAFAREYMARGLTIAWACNARVGLDYETMRIMNQANCRLLIVGYESGNDDILRNIKKGTSVDAIKQFARDAKRSGLLVLGDFIIGLPGETKATVCQTRELINQIRPDVLQVSVCSPFPGTELYEWAKKNGYLLTEDPNDYLDEKGHQKAIISYPELSNEEMVKIVDGTLRQYYLSPRYIPLALRQVFRRNGKHEFCRMWRLSKEFLRYLSYRKLSGYRGGPKQ